MKSLLKQSSIAAIIMLLVGTTYGFAFSQEKYNIPDHSKWMSNLRDDVPVRLVSIPGAHDAASGTINVAGTSCQNMNINDLFDAGCRYFDFRTGFTNGFILRMYHGIMDLSRTFSGVMNDLYKKLKENPTEFIIVEIAIEHETLRHDRAMSHLRSYFRHSFEEEHDVHNYWDNKKDFENAESRWMYLQPDVTVGEARGHMLLLFNVKYDDLDLMRGPYIPGRGDGPGNICYIQGYDKEGKRFDAPVHAQNNYHYSTFEDHPELKYEDYAKPQCEKFTEYLQQNQNTPVWGMNFLSAYIDVAPNQYDVAKEVNYRFARLVNSNPQFYLGIVLMDYFACPFYKSISATTTNGDLVVEAVINNNRRFWDYNKIYGSGKDRREPFEMKQN